MKRFISLFLTFISFNTFALYETEIDYLSEMSDEDYRSVNPRLYRAEGEHLCQSRDSLGHKCKVLGVNFTDCTQAFFKLKSEGCCSGSEYGGVSIEFKLTKCTNFN